MSTKNLLKETLEVMSIYNIKHKDILYCITMKDDTQIWFSLEHFKKISNIYYDNDIKEFNVRSCLILVGSNWLIKRIWDTFTHCEIWQYFSRPSKPELMDNILHL